MKQLLMLLAGLLLSTSLWAAIDTYQFDSVQQEEQYRELTASLRCPKCQNNSIADSNAMIAADMRLKVYELMQQGQSKDQIIAYMVARYGHFVSYEPPLTAGTLLLWLVPGLFVIAGVALLVARTRRRGGASAALSEQERQRLAALLNKGED